MTKSSSAIQNRAVNAAWMTVPAEIVSINQAAFDRAKKMLALTDRRMTHLEKDSEAFEKMKISELQTLARVIRNLQKDLQSYAAILYSNHYAALENQTLSNPSAQAGANVRAEKTSSQPSIEANNQKANEKFSKQFFNRDPRHSQVQKMS